jgi:hypothetical protein
MLNHKTAFAVCCARARTECQCLSDGPAVFGKPDHHTPSLVVYRPTGSAIVIPMHDPMPAEQFVAFMDRVTREEVRQRILLEAQKLTADAPELERAGHSKKAQRARDDASFLGEFAKTIPAQW